MSSPGAALRLSCCFTSLQLAEKQLDKAKELVSMRKKEDLEAALLPLECALELRPDWEAALELKARVLLYLKRFKDVVDMLHESVPSLQAGSPTASSSSSPSTSSAHSARELDSPVAAPLKVKARLLTNVSANSKDDTRLLSPLKRCLSIPRLSSRLSMSVPASLSPSRLLLTRAEKQRHRWRYPVLGQACFHLGMLEDAMVLLQEGKRSASDISRKKSNYMRDDNFCTDGASIRTPSMRSASLQESELVSRMLSNIKFLLRRRAAAIAALEAGLYAESVRHFSKIIDGRKGNAPQGFIADCHLHRAIAYQAMGRVVDAISDCNQCLVLNPHCSVQALSVRASLYEMVRCYSDCMLDLQQLKIIYEASLRYQSMLPELSSTGTLPACSSTIWQPHLGQIDFAGGLEYINSKITATRHRLSSGNALDAHTILDMPRNCTVEDVEKAYLLISLKHRADKAAQSVEKRDLSSLNDQKDPMTGREEARASAFRLSQLIHKAYTKLLSSIAQEERENEQEMSVCGNLEEEEDARKLGHDRREGGSRVDANSTERRKSTSVREKAGGERIRRVGFRNVGANSCDGAASLVGCSDGELPKINAEDADECDFCQPFGGFSSSTLANALCQALSNDLPVLPTSWSPDWTQLDHHSQPLPVP